MSIAFPDIRVGNPALFEDLSVYPLFPALHGGARYELSDAAILNETIVVQEVSEAGSVPELSVENKGDVPVLFLEGEELVGAKQNRVLNTSILVAAHSRCRIPVSCVEAGRWRYKSRRFGSEGRHCSSGMRRVLKGTVSKSLREKRGYRSDQREVWDEVARQQSALGAVSSTNAMSDTYETHRSRLETFRGKLPFVEGAAGIAVAVGGKLKAIDLFDKPETCNRVWDRLLTGSIMDAAEVARTGDELNLMDVERAVAELKRFDWNPVETLGEGQEYRAETQRGDFASALVLDGTLIHGSVILAR